MLDPPSKLYCSTDYGSHFDPRKYLEKFYSSVRPDEFEKETIPFSLKTLYHIFYEILKFKINADSSRLLEIGSGPSIMLSMFASNVFREIYLSDYLNGNRTELMKWLNYEADAFDWKPYVNYIREKNIPLNETVLEQVHEKVKDVLECDLKNEQVLSQPIGQMDAVACMRCLEDACETYGEYQDASKRIINLLKPTGYYIQSGMLNQSYCDAGAYYFRTLSTTRQQVVDTLDINGIDIQGWFDFEVPYCGATRTTTSPGTIFYICYGVKREE